MRFIFIFILTLTSYFLQASSVSQSTGPNLFEVTVTLDSEEKKFILFGTQHAFNFDDLPKITQNIVLSADNLIMEKCPLGAEMREKFTELGLITKDKQDWLLSLRGTQRAEIEDEIKQAQLHEEEFHIAPEYFTPFGALFLRHALEESQVVDWVLEKNYRQNAKQVRGLEAYDLKFNSEVVANIEENKNMTAREMLRERNIIYDDEEEYLEAIAVLGQMYLCGTIIKCEDEDIIARNLNWIPTMLQNLQESQGKIVIAVGMGHLYGRLGMIDLILNISENTNPHFKKLNYSNGEFEDCDICQFLE